MGAKPKNRTKGRKGPTIEGAEAEWLLEGEFEICEVWGLRTHDSHPAPHADPTKPLHDIGVLMVKEVDGRAFLIILSAPREGWLGLCREAGLGAGGFEVWRPRHARVKAKLVHKHLLCLHEPSLPTMVAPPYALRMLRHPVTHRELRAVVRTIHALWERWKIKDDRTWKLINPFGAGYVLPFSFFQPGVEILTPPFVEARRMIDAAEGSMALVYTGAAKVIGEIRVLDAELGLYDPYTVAPDTPKLIIAVHKGQAIHRSGIRRRAPIYFVWCDTCLHSRFGSRKRSRKALDGAMRRLTWLIRGGILPSRPSLLPEKRFGQWWWPNQVTETGPDVTELRPPNGHTWGSPPIGLVRIGHDPMVIGYDGNVYNAVTREEWEKLPSRRRPCTHYVTSEARHNERRAKLKVAYQRSARQYERVAQDHVEAIRQAAALLGAPLRSSSTPLATKKLGVYKVRGKERAWIVVLILKGNQSKDPKRTFPEMDVQAIIEYRDGSYTYESSEFELSLPLYPDDAELFLQQPTLRLPSARLAHYRKVRRLLEDIRPEDVTAMVLRRMGVGDDEDHERGNHG